MLPYTRTTEYTTAAAGLLAILNFFRATPLDSGIELEAWRSSVLLPTRACSVFGLALFAKEKGLQPKIFVESTEYDYPDYRFKRYTKTDVAVAQRMHALYVRRAQDANISIVVGDISFEKITELVLSGHVLLARLNEGVFRNAGSTSKYVVIFGKKQGHFLVLDPLQEQPIITVADAQLKESFETLTTKKKREHRLLAFKDV